MRLGYVKFSGYKRFKDEVTLNVASKMVALIGPNEAGKTSTLKLLKHISTDEKFTGLESYKYDDEITPKMKACFFLEKKDFEKIGTKVPKKLFVSKTSSGTREFSFDRPLIRDKSDRMGKILLIRKCLKHAIFAEKLSELYEINAEEIWDNFDAMDLDVETISSENLSKFDELVSYVSHEEMLELPRYVTTLPSKLEAFLDKEKAEHPNDVALQICKSGIPQVIEFTSDDRKLETSYNMTGYKNPVLQNRTIPCNALKSLAKVAGLDFEQLKTNLTDGKVDRIEKQIRNANTQLKEHFAKAWTQSDIKIHLGWDKPFIQIMVQERDSGEDEFILVDQRSDGLRQYIALFAFIMKENVRNPILLIDEAELHLHYDAQADLIQTLTRKNLAAKVIYTTHSAGCLPEDLGSGIKLVIPDKGDGSFSTSRIENKFWNSDNLGFSPILYGMGANTLAFFPTRKALIVEGQSDPLLIPTLFRQASGLEFNSFQVVPGMANASSEKIPVLALQGQRVAYLADNDLAGEEYLERLSEIGVSAKCLFKISSINDSIVTVEDWLGDKVFSVAVEKYRTRFYDNVPTFDSGFFDGDGKAEKLKRYEKAHKIDFSKVDLAYIILENLEDNPSTPIYNRRHKKAINELRKKVVKALPD